VIEAPVESASGSTAFPKFDAETVRETVRKIGPRALVIIGIGAILMATFAVGGLVLALGGGSGAKADEVAQAPRPDLPMKTEPSGGLTLVPADPTSTVGRSVTSAPLPNVDQRMPAEYQRSDATALPSEEYARIAADDARRSRETTFSPTDPRTVATGPTTPVLQPQPALPRAVRPRPAEPEPAAPARREIRRTPPVPISQPLPRYEDIRRSGTVRLKLTVDRSGRVTEVDVLDSARGITPLVIQKVQQWRFKPATENGEPTEGTFTVDVSFNRR
jgi:protein TonB